MTITTMVYDEKTARGLSNLRDTRNQWRIGCPPGMVVGGIEILPKEIPLRRSRNWGLFHLNKIELCRIAIETDGYVVWIDPTLTGRFPVLDEMLSVWDVIVSPHYASQYYENIFGKYNTGMFAFKSISLLTVWEEFIKQRLWYGDSKPFEYALEGRKLYKLGLEHNYGVWRNTPAKGNSVCGIPIESWNHAPKEKG